jgi:hypothetical protein
VSFEIVSITPAPSDEERAALEAALTELVAAEKRGPRESVWALAGRARGRRLGLSDYRARLDGADVWRMSLRWPTGGREYQGLAGRADAR